MRNIHWSGLWQSCSCAAGDGAVSDARLLRFPDINGDLVVFVYAGDIWSVAGCGRRRPAPDVPPGPGAVPQDLARRPLDRLLGRVLRLAPGVRHAGRGGTPRQLTYYNDVGIMPPRGGYDYVVLDWTPDSRQVLVRCNRTPWGERMGRYFLVALDGGLETPLPIPEGGGGTFSPDAGKIVYTPIDREFRTWKRYQGGRAQDVWIYDLAQEHLAAADRFSRHRPASVLVRATRSTSSPTAT